MKRQFIAEMRPGDAVDTVAGVRQRELRLSRAGSPYLRLELADRTGCIQAVRFDPAEADRSVPEGSVAHVRGVVCAWRGEPRVRLTAMSPAATYDRADLIPTTSRDLDELKAGLRAHVASIRDPGLRGLVLAVFAASGFARRFAECPGSAAGHHCWLGGLIEHTVAVAGLARGFASAYPQADADLLLAAALLHDSGCVDELEFDTEVGRSLRGRLAGHVQLGLRRIDDAARSASAPSGAARLESLRHAVLTHHEPADAPSPMTLEAILLREADVVDSAASAVVAAVGRAARSERAWTDGDNPLGRELLARPGDGPGRAAAASGPRRGDASAGAYLRAAG